MASKELYNVFRENFLTCHICLEEYRDPRVLPCYHTFCLDCIADHAAKNGMQNKFSCPVCRQDAPVPPGGLATLVKNLFLINVKDFMEDQKAPEGRLCDYCKHKEATMLCQGCPKTNQLCVTCRELHDNIPALNGHNFVLLSQVDFSADQANVQEQLRNVFDKPQFCDKHAGEPLAFYCQNDDTVICRECIVETHSKHQFKKLRDEVIVQRGLIADRLKCLPTEKLSRLEKAKKAIARVEAKLAKNQTRVLRLVDSQRVTMTQEIHDNSKTVERELNDCYRQIEQDVRKQTDAYLTNVKRHLELYRIKVKSNYIKMRRFIDNKSNIVSEEVKALTSAQVKTLEAEKDKQEMLKISIQSIRDFAQHLIDTGSDIEVMTHSKKIQARIKDLQTVEPVFDTKITDIKFTPGKTKMDLALQCPKILEPQLSIKTGPITAKTYGGPLDAYFGCLEQERSYCPELRQFQRVALLKTPKRIRCFNVKGWLWDIQCTADGCVLVVQGDSVSIFSNASRYNREISIEGGVRCISTVSNDRFVVTCGDKCCRLYLTSGQAIRYFGQGDMSEPWGVTVDRTEGKVYVCDGGAQCICVFDTKSFQLVNKIAIPMCSKVSLRCAYHHIINAIIVSDNSTHCVYAVTPQGDVMFQYGVRGHSGSGYGQLSFPRGVCIDKLGHIYIADRNNHRVVVLGSDGKFLHNILTRNDDIEVPVSVDISDSGELVLGTNLSKIIAYQYIDKT